MAAGSSIAAIRAACADACAGTATAIAAIAARATEDRLIIGTFCVIAVAAIAAVGSIAARGIHRTAANDVERVTLGQLDTGTATRGSAGIGSRAGQRRAVGDVKIHRAPDGQAAAACVAVGETEVRIGVIVRRVTRTAERLSRSGACIQGRPVCRGGLCQCIDFIPVVLRPSSLCNRAQQSDK